MIDEAIIYWSEISYDVRACTSAKRMTFASKRSLEAKTMIGEQKRDPT